MKILMFICSSVDGGAEKLVAELTNSLYLQGVNVTVAAFSQSQWLQRLHPEITVIELGKQESAFNPLLYLKFIKIIRKRNIDLVHSHGAKASKIIYRLSRLRIVKQLATKHNSRKGKIFNKLPYVSVVSKKAQESINSTNTIKIIYNGIQVNRHTQPIKPMSNQPFLLLAVGRLDPIKGFDRLIKAVAQCNNNIELSIIGEGREKPVLEQLITQYQLNERVKLLGYRTDIDVQMSKAHAVVISSYSEGFSLVMIEALFYANLFFSTAVGSAEEILTPNYIIDGENLSEAIQDLACNYPSKRSEYIEFAIKQQDHFGIEKVSQQYSDYYQAICKY